MMYSLEGAPKESNTMFCMAAFKTYFRVGRLDVPT